MNISGSRGNIEYNSSQEVLLQGQSPTSRKYNRMRSDGRDLQSFTKPQTDLPPVVLDRRDLQTFKESQTDPPPVVTIMPYQGKLSDTQLQTTRQYIAILMAERGSTEFVNYARRTFRDAAIALASATVSTALGSPLPLLWQIATSIVVSATATKIQKSLKLPDPGLRDDTILKVVEPNQGKVLYESTLRKTIKNVLSRDRQANEDLAKAFSKLRPTIKRVADTAINIEFPHVKLLITGDGDTINSIFNGFLLRR